MLRRRPTHRSSARTFHHPRPQPHSWVRPRNTHQHTTTITTTTAMLESGESGSTTFPTENKQTNNQINHKSKWMRCAGISDTQDPCLRRGVVRTGHLRSVERVGQNEGGGVGGGGGGGGGRRGDRSSITGWPRPYLVVELRSWGRVLNHSVNGED